MEELNADIEATIGDIGEPRIQTERPDTSSEARFLEYRKQTLNHQQKKFVND